MCHRWAHAVAFYVSPFALWTAALFRPICGRVNWTFAIQLGYQQREFRFESNEKIENQCSVIALMGHSHVSA